MVSGSPSGSVSLASTSMVTELSSAVVAASSIASGFSLTWGSVRIVSIWEKVSVLPSEKITVPL